MVQELHHNFYQKVDEDHAELMLTFSECTQDEALESFVDTFLKDAKIEIKYGQNNTAVIFAEKDGEYGVFICITSNENHSAA
jgi:hypothetical protein